ncbi:MAG: archaetidylserine decarboxylase [Puniceicoccales bacterium]|jgi:phosphatidylserine decarboxylase|nr:archaetidylserine decarboxylase [Puniceicoccales bacterium]
MEPIRFYNRYSQSLEEEPVFGERFLRWLYETPSGRFCEGKFFARRLFSSGVGWWMRRGWSRRHIEGFIRKYGINTEIFEKKPAEFRSFDEFFSRRIRRIFRPIVAQEDKLAFPCDGRHLVVESLEDTPSFAVKGQRFRLESLLGDHQLAEQFHDGSLLLSRLSPVDYHRFHFPCDVLAENPYEIRGRYSAVHPIAVRRRLAIFSENKRVRTLLHHPSGDVLMVEVGATCVGSIRQSFRFNSSQAKGDEKGSFHLGGSSILLLFEKNKLTFSDDLLQQSRRGIELYAFMGDEMATWN